MKKKDLKKLVMAGMVAGALAATGAVHAAEGEVVAAGTHGCGGGCGGKNSPKTADNYAPQQQQPNMQRTLTQQEEINRQQQLRQQNQQGQQPQGQPAPQGQHCSGGGHCNGKAPR